RTPGKTGYALRLSKPELGSDVPAIKTTAKMRDYGAWAINGQKMWVTNGLRSDLVFVLVRTDQNAEKPQRGMTCFIAEKVGGEHENTGAYAGLNVPPQLRTMRYKGCESRE